MTANADRSSGPAPLARRARLIATLPALLLALSAPAVADEVHRHAVHFAAGQSASVASGAVRGGDTAEYTLAAKAGQTMSVKLTRNNNACYFNVFAPGKRPGQDAAMFIGSTAGDRLSATLPADGTYLVQVYLMRSAARQQETCRYELSFAVNDRRADNAGGPRPMPGSTDAKVAGTPYHATATIACSLRSDSAAKECAAGVIRGATSASVVVTLPNGLARTLHFRNGTVTTQNATVRQSHDGDATRVVVDGAETFVIPDAFVDGG